MSVASPPPDPSRLTPAELARLLCAAGATGVTAESIKADVAAGAPTNAGGTLHLVHYGAWLHRQLRAHGKT